MNWLSSSVKCSFSLDSSWFGNFSWPKIILFEEIGAKVLVLVCMYVCVYDMYVRVYDMYVLCLPYNACMHAFAFV